MSDIDRNLIYGNLNIYPAGRMVYVDGSKIALTKMEFDVLYFLASNPDMAFTKEQIYETASKDNFADGSYTIRDIIYRLRTKLGISYIQTLYGYGYKFSAKD